MSGCSEVDDDHDDFEFAHLLHQSLHGWQLADNGEIVTVKTAPTILSESAGHPVQPGEDRWWNSARAGHTAA